MIVIWPTPFGRIRPKADIQKGRFSQFGPVILSASVSGLTSRRAGTGGPPKRSSAFFGFDGLHQGLDAGGASEAARRRLRSRDPARS